MRQGERITEYLDEFICLFRKARPGAFVQCQDEEVKNHLINGLPSDILAEVQGYVDLMAEEIARKYDLSHSFGYFICYQCRESPTGCTR